jgi:hypothetical protein
MSEGNLGSFRMLTLLVALVGLVCLANLIVVSVLLNSPSIPDVNLSPTINTLANPLADSLNELVQKQLHPNGSILAKPKSKRSIENMRKGEDFSTLRGDVFLVQYGHNFGAHEYFDKDHKHQGFFTELIHEVCAAAGIECRAVYDDYKNCLVDQPGEHPVGGQGLMGNWYDGCIGWAPTTERVHVFDFSHSFTKSIKSHYYVKTGSGFDSKNLKGKKIGFVAGWADNEKCLAQGSPQNTLEQNQIVYYKDPQTLAEKLEIGEIDAAFASEAALDVYAKKSDGIKKHPARSYECTMDGLSVMTRKDSAFLPLWNDGFQKIRDSGKLSKLCKRAAKHHGELGQIDCVLSGRMAAEEL